MPALFLPKLELHGQRNVSLNTGHHLCQGLIGAWPIAEGAGEKVVDYSGLGNHGVLGGAAISWTPQLRGMGLETRASTGKVSVTSNLGLWQHGATSEHTISVWWRQDAFTQNFVRLVDQFTDASNHWKFCLENQQTTCGVSMTIAGAATNLYCPTGIVTFTGVWFHAVFGFRGNALATFVINGSSTTAPNGSSQVAGNNVGIHFGNRGDAARPINGAFHNFAIWNRILSVGEAQELYQNPWVLYRKAPVQKATFFMGSIGLRIPNPNTLKPKLQNNLERPSFINRALPIAQNLIGAWPLTEGAGLQARDFSGSGLHGVLTAGPLWREGKFGNCLDFDYNDDKVVSTEAAINSKFSQSNSPKTVSFWINPRTLASTAGNFPRIIAFANAAGALWSIMLRGSGDSPANCIQLNTDTASTAAVAINSPAQSIPLADQWYHVVVSWTGEASAETRMFINGMQVPVSAGASNASGGATNSLVIGNRTDATARAFIGRISNVLIWDRLMHQGEVEMLYQDPLCLYRRRMEFRNFFLSEPTGSPAAAAAPATTFISQMMLMGVS